MLIEKTKHLFEGVYNSILEAVTPAEDLLKLDKEKLEEKKHEIDEQIIIAKTERNKLNGILIKYSAIAGNADTAANIELQRRNDQQASIYLKQKAQAVDDYNNTKVRIDQLDQNIRDLEATSKRAKLTITEQQAKIDQAIISSQISSAELTIAESINNVGKNAMDLERDFKRIEDKATNQTARASAIRDLASSGSIGVSEPKTVKDTLIEDVVIKELNEKKAAMGLDLPEEKVYSTEDFK
jgi:phage shock protein A